MKLRFVVLMTLAACGASDEEKAEQQRCVAPTHRSLRSALGDDTAERSRRQLPPNGHAKESFGKGATQAARGPTDLELLAPPTFRTISSDRHSHVIGLRSRVLRRAASLRTPMRRAEAKAGTAAVRHRQACARCEPRRPRTRPHARCRSAGSSPGQLRLSAFESRSPQRNSRVWMTFSRPLWSIQSTNSSW